MKCDYCQHGYRYHLFFIGQCLKCCCPMHMTEVKDKE